MTLQLFAHPFSSYCQKALIALYENETPFTYRMLSPDKPENGAEFAGLWPIKRFPVLLDGDKTVFEASIIIEHLTIHHPGAVRLIPEDPAAALDVRMMDRFFDNYISTPQQRVVFDALRAPENRNPNDVTEAKALLETAYAWLEPWMADREWACGETFSLADCGAAPFLFYADWTHKIDEQYANVLAYRRRLLARPSVVRAVDEARYFRPYFPLGAPDRD